MSTHTKICTYVQKTYLCKDMQVYIYMYKISQDIQKTNNDMQRYITHLKRNIRQFRDSHLLEEDQSHIITKPTTTTEVSITQ